MKKKIWIIVSILVILIGLSIIFAPIKDNKNIIEIGIIVPLTGPAANHGKDLMDGFNMAFDERSRYIDTSKYEIKLIIQDSQSSPQGGVNALQNIININSPVVVIGPVASSVMLAMIPIAEQNKVPLFSPAASSPKITNSGKYIYRMSLLAPEQAELLSEYAIKNGISKMGILYINDETGNSYMKAFEDKFTSKGGAIVIKESYDKKGIDFRTQIIKLKGAGIDGVFIPGVPRTTGLILKQAKELGLDIVFLGNYGTEGADLLTAAQGAAEGFVYASIPINIRFKEKFKLHYNKDVTIGAALGYDALNIVMSIVNDIGSDRELFINNLSQLKNFKGVTGTTTLLPNHDASKEVILKIVENH